MRSFLGAVILVLAAVVAAGVLLAAAGPPPWAYGFAAPAVAGPPPAPAPAATPVKDDGTLRHVAGSTAGFTLTQIRDAYGPADWYPGDHPTMPDIVAHGRRADVIACGLCHYPNGKGRPENAGVAGLPAAYIMQTMADFKSGARKSADSRKDNTNRMIGFAQKMTGTPSASSWSASGPRTLRQQTVKRNFAGST